MTNELRTILEEIRTNQIQHSKLLEELNIKVNGSKTFGINGLFQEHQANGTFQKMMMEEFNALRDDVVAMQTVLKEMQIQLHPLTVINIMTKPKTLKLLFILGLCALGALTIVKLKLLQLLQLVK